VRGVKKKGDQKGVVRDKSAEDQKKGWTEPGGKERRRAGGGHNRPIMTWIRREEQAKKGERGRGSRVNSVKEGGEDRVADVRFAHLLPVEAFGRRREDRGYVPLNYMGGREGGGGRGFIWGRRGIVKGKEGTINSGNEAARFAFRKVLEGEEERGNGIFRVPKGYTSMRGGLR